MRSERTPRRGEVVRVAERVRTLLAEHTERAGYPSFDTFGADGADARFVDEIDGLEDVDDAHGRDDDHDRSSRAGSRWDEPAAAAPAATAWRRLRARLGWRADPGRRSAVAVGVAVLVAAVLTGAWLMSHRAQSAPVPANTSAVPGSTPLGSPLVSEGTPGGGPPSRTSVSVSSGGSSSVPTQVVVDVAGKVRRPGLYHLPTGARVDDAIRAAGGALSGVDLSSLNLAARVTDGQQIAVGKPGAAPLPVGDAGSGAPGAQPGEAGNTAGPVDLNTATLEQLETLPGIGPALGQRILDYRSAHGGSFTSVDQLDDVSGIGTVTFARLKPLVTV